MENQGTIAIVLIVGLVVGLGVGYMIPGLMAPPVVEPTDL